MEATLAYWLSELSSSVGGVVFIRFRRQIAVLMANGQRDFFGEVGRRVAPSSTPALSAWVGAGFIALGVISVFCALFLKVSS